MACFIVPATEAIVTTVAAKVIKNTEKEEEFKIRFSTKLGWLNKMLWGGTTLLGFEHIWHGEVVPTFPFLSAVSNGEVSSMLTEMGTNGVMMSVLVTAVWAGLVAAVSVYEKKANKTLETGKGIV